LAHAACDCIFAFADEDPTFQSRMLPRVEISDRKVQRWTDYTNPVTRDGSAIGLLTLHALQRDNGTERPASGRGPSPREA
jgi:hypothetical protein